MRSLIVSILLVAGSLMVVQLAANFLQTWQGRRHVDYQASLPLSYDHESVNPFIGKASAETKTLHRPSRPAAAQSGRSDVPAVERLAKQ